VSMTAILNGAAGACPKAETAVIAAKIKLAAMKLNLFILCNAP